MGFNIEKKIAEMYGDENIAGQDTAQIELYWSWYRGYNEKFHNYRAYNGENYIYLTKKSLQMAKKVSETWADLLINERCDFRLDDNAKEDLDVILEKTKFWSKANKSIELAFALGYSALLGEITSNRKLKIVLLNAKNIIPIKIENDEVVDCAFYKTVGKNTIITVWQKESIGYKVTTNHYNKDGKLLESNEFQTRIDKPLFMIIKPNIISNSDIDEYNVGISIYANAIDTLKAIDTKYDGFDFEFIGGRKKVYISADAMKVVMSQDGTSTQVKPFDPLDSTYYNVGDSDDGHMVQEGGGELRSAQYIEALNFELGILSEKVGLGYGYFRFDSKGLSTATQVISENSDLFRTLKKHEIEIRDVMIPFIQAVIEYSNAYCDLKVSNYNEDEIDILFDDSIIEDKQAEKQSDMIQVQAGTMSYVEYAIKWYAMSEEDAKAKYLYLDIVKKGNAIMPLLDAKLITPELAIELIYGDDSKAPKIDINKLKEYLEKDPLNIDDGEFDDEQGADDTEGNPNDRVPESEDEPNDDDLGE